MDTKSALSQITETLYRLRAFDPQLRSKITDDHVQRYVEFSQRDEEHLACPVCFLAKGRVSYMRTGLPGISAGEEDLVCNFCATRIPIVLPSQRVA